MPSDRILEVCDGLATALSETPASGSERERGGTEAHILNDSVRGRSLVVGFREVFLQSDGGKAVVVVVQRRIGIVVGQVAFLQEFDDPLGVLDRLILVLVCLPTVSRCVPALHRSRWADDRPSCTMPKVEST